MHSKDEAIRPSLIGTHALVAAQGAGFVSLLEPPEAAAAAARCASGAATPCWWGRPGSTDVVLGSPIILYDYPEIAAQSAGALFDSTEIDEILTLRVMTMTDAEKAEARATDPRAAESSTAATRCRRDPGRPARRAPQPARRPAAAPTEDLFVTDDVPGGTRPPTRASSPRPTAWSSTACTSAGQPGAGPPLTTGRCAGLFFADQVARVTAVLGDVDGGTHVALVLVDDPAADMHESRRDFYFAPEELQPLAQAREESRP